MFDAAIARGYLGDLQVHTPSFGEKIRQFARNPWASLCRLLTGFHTNANAELITIPACSIEDTTLLEAAFKAEYTELSKRKCRCHDELRYSPQKLFFRLPELR
jgi:hypothetical protein